MWSTNNMRRMKHVMTVASLLTTIRTCCPYLASHGLEDLVYFQPGDILIAGFVSIRVQAYSSNMACEDVFLDTDIVEYTVYFRLEIERISKHVERVLGLTVGFVIVDDCYSDKIGALNTLRFVQYQNSTADLTVRHGMLRSYRVIGGIGPVVNFFTSVIASLMGAVEIPVINFSSMSDELSNKKAYPSFLRLVSPFRHYIYGIVHFLKKYSLNYFSLILDVDMFGEYMGKKLRSEAAKQDWCIYRHYYVGRSTNYSKIVKHLVRGTKVAKVVIALVSSLAAQLISAAVKLEHAKSKLLFIGNNMFHERVEQDSIIDGMIVVSEIQNTNNTHDFFENFNISREVIENPWFLNAFEAIFNCYENYTCILSAMKNKENNERVPLFAALRRSLHLYSSVLQEFHNEVCTAKGKEFLNCFYMHRTDFKNMIFHGVESTLDEKPVLFSKEGDVLEVLEFYQIFYSHDEHNTFYKYPLGSYFTLNNTLITYEDILWKAFEFSPFQVRAEAYCRPPCPDNHYKLLHNNMCCWACKRCKHNEIVSKNRTMCNVCPHLSWPQKEPKTNSTICVEIVAQELDLSSSIIICFLFLATVCMLATCLLGLKFYLHKDQVKVIQDTENTLIFGCITSVLGYFTVPIYIFKSTDITCNLATFNFIANLTSMYTAINFYSLAVLKKDIEIHSRNCNVIKLPWPLVTASFYLILNGSYVMIVYTHPIQALKHQPVLEENVVERTCNIYAAFFIPFYLFALATLMPAYHCAYLSCSHTDTKFQSLTVRNFITWTCILWTAFLPAYQLTMSRIIKMYYLLGAIIVNNIMMFFTLVNILYGQKIWSVISEKRVSLKTNTEILVQTSSVKDTAQTIDPPTDTSPTGTTESMERESSQEENDIKRDSIPITKSESQKIHQSLVSLKSLHSGSNESSKPGTQEINNRSGSLESSKSETKEKNNGSGSLEGSKPGAQEVNKRSGPLESSKSGTKETNKRSGSQESSKSATKETNKRSGPLESSKSGTKETNNRSGSLESFKSGTKETNDRSESLEINNRSRPQEINNRSGSQESSKSKPKE